LIDSRPRRAISHSQPLAKWAVPRSISCLRSASSEPNEVSIQRSSSPAGRSF
jgi:hypothetical protein